MTRTIVLCYPRAEPDWPDPQKLLGLPLAVLTVARALVGEGYDVRIVDENALARAQPALRALPRPLFAGISCIGGGQLRHGMQLARTLARLWPGVPRVWGGWNPTLLPELYEQPRARRYADVVVRGRGEATALALAHAFERGDTPRGIPGVSWWGADGTLVREPDAALDDPTDAGLLPYELIADHRPYITSQGMVNYVSSYGCPHRCSFCGIPAGTRTFKFIATGRVVEQLGAIRERLRAREILFLDDNFFTSRARVVELARGLDAAKLELGWHSNGRIEQVDALSTDELGLLARSGCRSLNVGYETGDQHVADRVHKDLDVRQVLALAPRLRAAKIRLSLNFMVGLPGETPQSLVGSLETLKAVHALHPGLEVCWYMFMPAPATHLWEELIAEGTLTRPTTLEEHARLQPYYLEHPWFYASPPRDVWRESRTLHKAIVWTFFTAYAAHLPSKGPLAPLARWLRGWCRWRYEGRRFGFMADWAAAYALRRARTALRWQSARAGRTALLAPVVKAAKARAGKATPAWMPVSGVHRST